MLGGPGVYLEEFLCLEPGAAWRPVGGARAAEEALEVDIPGIPVLSGPPWGQVDHLLRPPL